RGFLASVSRHNASSLLKTFARCTVSTDNATTNAPPVTQKIFFGNARHNPAATSATMAVSGRYAKWSDTRENTMKYMSKNPITGNSITAKPPKPNNPARPQLRRNHQHAPNTTMSNNAGANTPTGCASICQRG